MFEFCWSSKLFKYQNQNDPFEETSYNLEAFYFKYEDYEVFFPRNQERADSNIMKRREKIKNKMLKIHNKVYNSVKKFNLDCHWRDENITSLIKPSVYNKGKVNWLGVRYGKNKKEVQILDKGTNENYGFHKNACLQFVIHKNGFIISLFHAVEKNAVDREYMHDRLYESKFINNLEREINNLKGHGFVWNIIGSDNSQLFDIDKRNTKKFISFYKKYDCKGKESYLSYSVKPDDNDIKDIKSIEKLVINKFSLLIPLYNLITFRNNC